MWKQLTAALKNQSADKNSSARHNDGMISALNRSQAIIEFSLDGTVIDANKNFLDVLGYTIEEIRGQHHSMFVDPIYRQSPEYRAFWAKLGRGEFDSAVYKRIGKGGKEVWIQASYNPVFDENGKPVRVVKIATDITEMENQTNELKAKYTAIGKAQAVIEFKLDGTTLWANENFLSTMGYSAAEIVGQHHSMFVDRDYARSADYRLFWERLHRGEFIAEKFKRVGRGGREVWLQASYNPILDLNGKPFKVVKFATDITATENEINEIKAKIEAIGRSQAVIEFKLDGTVISANENFLATLGYSATEIVGHHHSMFVDPDYAKSPDYRLFWDRLNRGEFVAEKFRRIGRGGKEVWIQASYNPLLDLNGKPFKVIKFATDVTAVENERRATEQERAAKAAEQAQVVQKLAENLKALSGGNLTARINEVFAGDYEQLRTDFNAAMN